jgi:DNA primase
MEIPRLHPDTIDQVKQRTDIVDVVSEHVVLKKRGKDFVGLCPFHDDKSPSFTVSPGKQFYYCFSCGAGGNTIKFLMELGKRSFSDVVFDLARRYQVPVKTLEPAQRQEFQRQLSLREQLYEILALTAKFYEHALRQTDGQVALDYLEQSRHLSQDTIQQFQLGYAPGGWQTLYGYLVEQKHYPVELVEKAGLLVPRQSGDGYYDRFRDRLMIPIHDIQGRVIGFGGRTLSDEQPKYLNSPETELFDKGRTLFGLDKARAAIAKADRAVVVEGYFDVIALHSAGIENAVASLGTALSTAQVKQILRYTESKQIILNFDTDAAGVKAAERAIGEVSTLAHQGDVQLRILSIPSGKDPDEFLQTHSAEHYRTLLNQAPLWLDWQIQQLFLAKDLKQADHFHEATREITHLLADIASADLRTHYIRHCAEIFSQGDSRLVPLLAENLLAQVRRRRRRAPDGVEDKTPPPSISTSLLEQAEAALLRIYLHAEEYRDEVVQALEERDLQFGFSHHRFLWRQILDLQEADATLSPSAVTTGIGTATAVAAQANLLTLLRDRCAESPGQLNQVSHLFYLEEKTERDILRGPLVIRAAVACLERTMCEKRCRHFLRLWSEADCATTPDLCQYYQQQIYAEKKRIEELDHQRCTSFEDLAQIPWVGEFYTALRQESSGAE